ncbi:hypothetical protein [Streptacidiphilus rugosus]|uniref:hypothetical protein n=1 Tax=Streptacidiphilus rugosus TaxID=405783 RepID=UPI00068CE051|nr:hypothetical protein [Streptacidiphilus rugosus]
MTYFTNIASPSPMPSMITHTTLPAATSGGGTGVLLATVLSGAFLAALITATINIWLARRKSREEECDRLRTAFAEAFATYSAYKEMPYAIRRRRADQPAEERTRLSETLREIQARLAYHQAWILLESSTAGTAYQDLVNQLRAIAGAAMSSAWADPPLDNDPGMNIPPSVIDLSGLRDNENTYLEAVRGHLHKTKPWWSR